MKTKLIYAPSIEPPHRFNRWVFPPLGIAQLKSFAANSGFRVELDDLNIKLLHELESGANKPSLLLADAQSIRHYLEYGKCSEDLHKAIEIAMAKVNYKGYDVIGVSCIEPFQELCGAVLAKHIKEQSGITVIGGFVDRNPSLMEQYSFIDYSVYGDGEVPFVKLLESLDKGEPAISNPQTMIRKDGRIIVNPYLNSRPRLCDLPAPDFEGLPLELYADNPFGLITATHSYKFSEDLLNPGKSFSLLVLPFLFIRGCTRKCTICRNEFDVLDFKSPQRIAEELTLLKEKFRTKFFIFYNQHVNVSHSYLSRLCDGLMDLDIRWAESAVPDKILSREMLIKMKKSGCVQLNLGVESGSQRTLNLIEKRTCAKEMDTILRDAHEAGIWTYVDFLVGLPYESDSDFDETLEFISRNAQYIDDYQCGIFTPRPPSAFYFNQERFRISLRDQVPFASRATDEFPYDETEGLKWEDKQKRNYKMREAVYESLDRLTSANLFVPLPTLFHLYNRLQDKLAVREWLNQDHSIHLPKGTRSSR